MKKSETIIEPNVEILSVQKQTLESLRLLLSNSQVETIGAMAVPMMGRPELDFLVISRDVEGDSNALVLDGYKQGPIVDGKSFLKKMIGEIEVAVQIMSPENKMIETHRKILELLKENLQLRTQYEEFKKTLAGLSREEYKEKKNAWIRENIKPFLV